MTCMCGFPLSEHFNPELAERNGRRTKVADWDYKRHTSTRPTNAFGEIQFVGFGDKVAKVRILRAIVFLLLVPFTCALCSAK